MPPKIQDSFPKNGDFPPFLFYPLYGIYDLCGKEFLSKSF